MSGEEQIEKKLEELAQAIGGDDGLVEDVMSHVDKVAAPSNDVSESRVITLARRLNMKGYRKVAAAALLIIAAALMVTFLNKSASTAYALEQTVEAMQKVRFLHLVRYNHGGLVKDERWIEIGDNGRQVRYRQEHPLSLLLAFQQTGELAQDLTGDLSMVPMAVEDGNATALYRYDKETVVIYDREDKQYQWVGDLGVYLENLRDEGEIIKLNDEYKGEVAHRVLWPMMGDEGYIDPETKLPIAIGETEFSYEEPAADMFEIVVPEGYAVVDLREGAETGEVPQWVLDMDSSDDSFERATHALADGELAEAAELLEHVTKQEPGRNWAWYWLGSAYYGLGEYEPAIEKYTKVIEMFEGKGCHYCYYARGLAYKQLGMDDAAAADMEVCLGVLVVALRKPKAAEIFEYAGNPLIRYGQYKPTEAEMVVNTIDRLRLGTGQNFGFDPNGTIEEKEAAIAAWEQWYQGSAGSQ